MTIAAESVERHYGRGQILAAIDRALAALGKDLARLVPADLAPVDEFHIRGREATIELAARAPLAQGERVLDVGCGLGGSARFLAAERGCRVVGIDLTREYVDVATELAARVGLAERVAFRRASALALPFEDRTFDAVWTEHAQMNIADKRTLYAEIARVLLPGAPLLFHDIFAGPGGEPHFPVPWADDASISFLASPDRVSVLIDEGGMEIVDWTDVSRKSHDWFAGVVARLEAGGPPPLGLHLLMGDNARMKFANLVRNLAEARVVVVQGVARKR